MLTPRIAIAATAALLLLAASGPTAAPRRPGALPGAPNEVLVRLRPDAPATARQALAVLGDASSATWIGDGGVLRLRSRTLDTDALIARLSQRPEVVYAEPNYRVEMARVPNDPRFPSLWSLENTGQEVNGRQGTAGADLHAPQAWELTTGSENTIVGVLDTGIDYRHPDLAANVWSAPGSFPVTIGGVTRICPQGAHGYNALDHSFDPDDDNDHGTHVAGVIGAVGDNGVGVTGVNWTTQLMGLKILDAAGNGTVADAIDAVEFAIQARIRLRWSGQVRVLSGSWTVSGPSQALREQLERADRNEMLCVAAAGNAGVNLDESPSYPAAYHTASVLTVAATDMTDTLAPFSNTGAGTVQLGAPGVNVLSTVRNGDYAPFDGTSAAAAHVAGTAALMLSRDRGLSVAQLQAGLLGGVDPLPSLQGVTESGGRLNAFRSVSALGPRLDFQIDLFNEPTISVVRGRGTGIDVLVSTTQSYGGDVTLTVEGLPPGATATPERINGGGLVSVYVHISPNTPVGRYPVTLRGTGGTLSHSLTPTLEVQSEADFAVTLTPQSRRVKPGQPARFTVRAVAGRGFRQPIELSLGGQPPSASVRWGRQRIVGSGRVPLILGTNRATSPGTYPFTVYAQSGDTLLSTEAQVIVNGRR